MNRVQRKQSCRDQRDSLPAQPAKDAKDQQYDQRMQDDVRQVKTERHRPRNLVENKYPNEIIGRK